MKAGVNHADERVFQVETRPQLKSLRQEKVNNARERPGEAWEGGGGSVL